MATEMCFQSESRIAISISLFQRNKDVSVKNSNLKTCFKDVSVKNSNLKKFSFLKQNICFKFFYYINMLSLNNIILRPSVRCLCLNVVRHAKKRIADPGISNRKKLLEINETEEFEDFDDFESDFMQADKSHKQHLQEMEMKKEKLKYYIVRERYFKEKFPNFLTWHDKEQIRHLYRTNPQEWTIERLAEGFPASPEVIQVRKYLNFN